jgi:hypothetical protein
MDYLQRLYPPMWPIVMSNEFVILRRPEAQRLTYAGVRRRTTRGRSTSTRRRILRVGSSCAQAHSSEWTSTGDRSGVADIEGVFAAYRAAWRKHDLDAICVSAAAAGAVVAASVILERETIHGAGHRRAHTVRARGVETDLSTPDAGSRRIGVGPAA